MRYEIERSALVISATELCNLALLSGNLDARHGMTFSDERVALSPEMQKKWQDGADMRSEYDHVLTATVYHHGISFEISGRIDRVTYAEAVTVEEILSFRAGSDARAKCLAYLFCLEKGLDRVTLCMTDCTGAKPKREQTDYTVGELKLHTTQLLDKIGFFAEDCIKKRTERLPSACSAVFPYSSLRAGQEILMAECYRDLKAGKRLFAEAPTGIGKTLSALYPAVRLVGEEKAKRIFYLTAKAAPRKEAYRAAEKLFKSGAKLRTVVLTAKEQLCRNAEAKADPCGVSGYCNAGSCPYAKGFYDRLLPAVAEALSVSSGYPRVFVSEIAEKYRICPYEFQLALSEYCEILICDYNYVFDPSAYLRRYFEGKHLYSEDNLFLIDEAHNLASRASAMYSAQLSNTAIKRILPVLGVGEFYDALCDLDLTMGAFRKLCRDSLETGEDQIERGYYLNKKPFPDFFKKVSDLSGKAEDWLKRHKDGESELPVRAFLSELSKFSLISDYYDEHFLTFLEVEGEERKIRLICLDASEILDRCMNRAKSAVLFSATLQPTDYFVDILGGGKQAKRLSLPSPFPSENLSVTVVDNISTRYRDREKSYGKIASYLAAMASGKPGNYLAFFPSYEYLERVFDKFSEKYPQVTGIRQKRGMTAQEKEQFLSAFADDRKLRVGFCVLGGSFSEGIDLPGGLLIGTLIVGTGLPGISSERNILMEYYDATRERGYDYAYTYPGMIRVLQAAGRVIRKEDDRGVLVLLDDRYARADMKILFPEHWKNIHFAKSPSELAKTVSDFWENT